MSSIYCTTEFIDSRVSRKIETISSMWGYNNHYELLDKTAQKKTVQSEDHTVKCLPFILLVFTDFLLDIMNLLRLLIALYLPQN